MKWMKSFYSRKWKGLHLYKTDDFPLLCFPSVAKVLRTFHLLIPQLPSQLPLQIYSCGPFLRRGAKFETYNSQILDYQLVVKMTYPLVQPTKKNERAASIGRSSEKCSWSEKKYIYFVQNWFHSPKYSRNAVMLHLNELPPISNWRGGGV